ncbi:MAG: MMPL family transporter [Alcanivoracaceae bacterium]|nr:MMPL family transporter [Alcanivoracaceae bacterium]
MSPHRLFGLYQRIVLNRPKLWLVVLLAVSLVAAWQVRHFRLDASADSLVLEHDKALEFYREVSKRYGGSDFLIVTYTPKDRPLFDPATLEHLEKLHGALSSVEQVQTVTSMLDVPLLFSPQVKFADLASNYRTLRDDGVDLALAEKEFVSENPVYRDMLVSRDARTTALLVSFARDEHYYELLYRRNDLDLLNQRGELDEAGQQQLAEVRREFSDYNSALQARNAAHIREFRAILDAHRDQADLFLGGVPMIATDMIRFIRSDLSTFGVGVVLFILISLLIIFRQPRWAAISLACCGVATLWLTGLLGTLDWKVTVISSNYVSLLLIITMSITIHLIVRYREFQQENPDAEPRWLAQQTTLHMMRPSIYMILTTMVGFASLVISDIRPVMDFGWMMTFGIGMALVICYLLMPAVLMMLPAGKTDHSHDYTRAMTLWLASITERFRLPVLLLAAVIFAAAAVGVTRLTVENRFIDYFKDDTEIHQGMLLIDQKLGGTTPLDIVIDAPEGVTAPTFSTDEEDPFADPFAGEESDPFADPFADAGSASDDPFADPFAEPQTAQDNGFDLSNSYWYTPQRLAQLVEIQDWLSSHPETGKVLSLATTYEVAEKLNGGPLSYMQLMLLSSFIPADLRNQLMKPYLSPEGDQLRISIRVIDSDPSLQRNELIERIRHGLIENFDLKPEQVKMTGALVMYNNMLQSLFDSQIKTLGFVFLAIFLMLIALFRKPMLAAIALVPSLISAAGVLGLMGWIGLPLDLMTITIAAITVGIAVDDSIHYIHRFSEELPQDQDYVAAMKRSHGSIGRAMYYTSITIIAGFSILTLSNFNPTVYFGVLTGAAMAMALLCNLTVLPALLTTLKPKLPDHS